MRLHPQVEVRRKNPPSVTDRALRYRANQMPPDGEKRCLFCGSRQFVEVGHVDGFEEHTEPENLAWTCRSCNTRMGIVFRNAGIGRRTRQYNPANQGATSAGAWMNAVLSMKGEGGDMSVSDAVALIKATPASRRAKFSEQLWSKRRKIYGRSGRATREEVPF